MALGMEVGLGPGHCLDGNPALLPQRATAPNFWPMSVVAKRLDGLIKMPLSMEVVLGPGDFMLDGNPALPDKRNSFPPNLRPMSLVLKRLDG